MTSIAMTNIATRPLLLSLTLSFALSACAVEEEFTGDDFDDLFGEDQKADGVTALVHYSGILDERGYTHFGPNWGREYGEHHVVTVTETGASRLHFDVSPNVFPGVVFYGNEGENIDLVMDDDGFDVNVYRLIDVDEHNRFTWSKRLHSDNTGVSFPLSSTGIYLAVIINKSQNQDAGGFLSFKRHEVVPFKPSESTQTATISMPNFTKEVWGRASREIASCGLSALDMMATIKVPFRIVGFDCEEADPAIEGGQITNLFMGGMNTTLDVELILPEESVVTAPTMRSSAGYLDMQNAESPRIDIENFRDHCHTTIEDLSGEYYDSNPVAASCGHVSSVEMDVPSRFHERVHHQTRVWLAPVD